MRQKIEAARQYFANAICEIDELLDDAELTRSEEIEREILEQRSYFETALALLAATATILDRRSGDGGKT